MRLILCAAVAVALSACSMTTAIPGAMDADTGPPTRGEIVLAVADTAAKVADAAGQAPPATLSRTTIDERAIRAAFVSFDHVLTLIDTAVEAGVIKRNTPRALSIRTFVRTTQAALNSASAAQRAGNAATYSTALAEAKRALASLQLALTR